MCDLLIKSLSYHSLTLLSNDDYDYNLAYLPLAMILIEKHKGCKWKKVSDKQEI